MNKGISREAVWGDGESLMLHRRKSHQGGSVRLKQDYQTKNLELEK